MKIKMLLGVVVLGLMISGCATFDGMPALKGTGKIKTYPVAYEEIWKSVPDVLRYHKLDIQEINEKNHYITSTYDPSAYNFEIISVFVTGQGENKTEVEIIVKRFLLDPIGRYDWSYDIFYSLDTKFTPSQAVISPQSATRPQM